MDTLVANLLAEALRAARANAVATTLGQEAQIATSLVDMLRRMPTATRILEAANDWAGDFPGWGDRSGGPLTRDFVGESSPGATRSTIRGALRSHGPGTSGVLVR